MGIDIKFMKKYISFGVGKIFALGVGYEDKEILILLPFVVISIYLK